MMRNTALLLAFLFLASAQAQISAGPMLGPITQREATVWVQTQRDGEVRLRYVLTAPLADRMARHPILNQTEVIHTNTANDHIATFRLTNLEPGSTYGYHVEVDGQIIGGSLEHDFTTQPLWQWRWIRQRLRQRWVRAIT